MKARLKSSLRKLPGARAARFVLRLLEGIESRHKALLMLRPPKGLFQPYPTTSEDRYPQLFLEVRALAGDSDEMRVLSFGCATGEEVFTLRRYFPLANIVGLDINPLNIALGRKRLRKAGDSRIRFVVASSTEAEPRAAYDAIFALSVFRHGDLNTSPPPGCCDPPIRFADFERSIAELARTLKAGGLLVLGNAMFPFAATQASAGFETVLTRNLNNELGPVYGIDNRLLHDLDYTHGVYRKIG